MRNKRWILPTLLLVICLIGGGLYYSLSHSSFPCPIVSKNPALLERLRIAFYHDWLATKLKQAALMQYGAPAGWRQVDVQYMATGEWECYVDESSNDAQMVVVIRKDGSVYMALRGK
jgi:hypothetical protein